MRLPKNATPEEKKAFYKAHYAKYRETSLRCSQRLRDERPDLIAAQRKRRREKLNAQGIVPGRDWMLKNKYGMTEEDFAAMLASQDGVCAVCKTNNWGGPSKTPKIDHCHTSGKVRGILCDACNTGIGKFKDDPVRLSAAIEYLLKHKGG